MFSGEEEKQKELEKGVGTIDPERNTLDAKKVKIVKVTIEEVGEKKNKKIVCKVEHPDAEDVISISSVAILQDKKIVNIGLWFNLDKEDNIQKGSALATFLNHAGSSNILELEGKEVDTELNGKYLCFKAY